jgi:hypothetical protein
MAPLQWSGLTTWNTSSLPSQSLKEALMPERWGRANDRLAGQAAVDAQAARNDLAITDNTMA